MLDTKAIAEATASVVKELLKPLAARIDELEKQIADLPEVKDGRDGLDVKDMFRAEGGKLIAVMSDGTTRDLGEFVGKDGKPGRDGFNLEDFDATLMEDGRTILLSFERGDEAFKVELGIPAMIYRGVFAEGKKYERGDTVTFGGSLWHCDEDTDAKPGEGQKAWTLAAKRGRDGKPGKDLMPPAPKQPIKIGGA